MIGDATLARDCDHGRAIARPAEHACFVAGTLVHAKQGLVPIETLKVADWVATRQALQGALTYKRVTRTVAHDDKEVWLLEYVVNNEATARSLVVTGERPFWVRQGKRRSSRTRAHAPLHLSASSFYLPLSAPEMLRQSLRLARGRSCPHLGGTIDVSSTAEAGTAFTALPVGRS